MNIYIVYSCMLFTSVCLLSRHRSECQLTSARCVRAGLLMWFFSFRPTLQLIRSCKPPIAHAIAACMFVYIFT